jgi:hypothetical protein
MDVQKKEWNDLKEGERNSMMWPDFLLWHEPHEVEIRRPNPNESLGLVTITVQVSFTVCMTRLVMPRRYMGGDLPPSPAI